MNDTENTVSVTTAGALSGAENSSEEHIETDHISPYTGREMIDHIYPYQTLTAEQKMIYDILFPAISGMDEIITFSDFKPDFDDVEYVYKMIHNDEYTFFNTDNKFMYKADNDGRVEKLLPGYIYTDEEAAKMQSEIDKTADEILSGLNKNMSEYEICLHIHDSLIRCCTYGTGPYENNIYGALAAKTAKCQGYSKAFAYLCSKAGVTAMTVLGNTDSEHMWNIASIDGEYYHIDLTWDDPDDDYFKGYVKYDYFGLSDDEIKKYRTINGNEYPIPSCTGTLYNYFSYKGLVVSDTKALTGIILAGCASKDNDGCIQFKAADEESYKQITDYLFGEERTGGELFRILSLSNGPYGTSADFVINNKNFVIKIFLHKKTEYPIS